jgi:methionyl-tRNA synthetase
VPDDPSQVVYVWFDALGNYISALDYRSGGDRYRTWWREADERVHVIGKGITRFHAAYWPAILLSADEPLPTTILVHDYLTVDGQKLSKSRGASVDPAELASRYGADALRWWFIRGVPRSGDADFREELLAGCANELADDLGNLVNRTIALAGRFRPDGVPPAPPPIDARALVAAIAKAPEAIDEALGRFDFRAAAEALWHAVAEANRFVSATRPWELGKLERGDRASIVRLDAVLGALHGACRAIAHELRPFLPNAATRIEHALERGDPELGRRLFPKAGVVSDLARDARP